MNSYAYTDTDKHTQYPDNMTTLALNCTVGVWLSVRCNMLAQRWANHAINFMNFIYVSEILLMLAQYWGNDVLGK